MPPFRTNLQTQFGELVLQFAVLVFAVGEKRLTDS
jgi:hypothetical protein